MNSMNILTSYRRIIRLGFVNFWRNWWLSLAASLMIMLTLVTMGIFAILNIFASAAADGIKERIGINVYLYDSASEEQVKDLQYAIANRADVKKVNYISKEEALAIWQKRPLNSRVKSLVTKEENSLPRHLEIKPTEPDILPQIVAELESEIYKPLIRSITYEETKEPIERLIKMARFIQLMGWVVTLFLLSISLIVIMNTIRLTVFTRRDEIEVMRLVGANNAFIRVPFSVEAILYGLMGGLLAYLLVAAAMSYFGSRIANYFADVAVIHDNAYYQLISPYFNGGVGSSFGDSLLVLWQLGLIQIAIGILFAVSCSLIAIRRYLRI